MVRCKRKETNEWSCFTEINLNFTVSSQFFLVVKEHLLVAYELVDVTYVEDEGCTAILPIGDIATVCE